MNRKNIFRRLACVSLLLAASAGAGAQHPVSIVPKPLHLEQTEEQFVLKSGMTIACEEGLKEQAEYLSQMLRQATGWEIKVRPDSRKGNIVLVLDTVANKHSEGYSLSVDKKSIRISGADEAGV
ncbi:MAG: glycoside hydrolase family 20 zincin-like fold domain-containing protein, partial [Candidatus Paraprevotella stercoravium]|nr:glycoside hydrolase family 20 zincin-like fold domain-containing protein [Candidatus Paraprevotella stercoravium]